MLTIHDSITNCDGTGGVDSVHRMPLTTTLSHRSHSDNFSPKRLKPCGMPLKTLTLVGTLFCNLVSRQATAGRRLRIWSHVPSVVQQHCVQQSLIPQHVHTGNSKHRWRQVLNLCTGRISWVQT